MILDWSNWSSRAASHVVPSLVQVRREYTGRAPPPEFPLLLAAEARSRHVAIYDALRDAMLVGRLVAGARLPATRDLARQLGVARGTVVAAYDRLTSEGYFQTARGAGTFVVETLPDSWFRPTSPKGRTALMSKPAKLADRGVRLARSAFATLPLGPPLPFRPHTPATEHFPKNRWTQLVTRHARHSSALTLREGDPRGYRPLREALAHHLMTSRGVRCTADQILVTTGIHQGLDLALRLLVDVNDEVWIENPGYFGARHIIDASGATVVPVRVDTDGIDVDHVITRHPGARFAYVTPAHQCPMGATLSLERRIRLLDWADGARAWVFEDDYDSEFRYSGKPVPALQSLDQRGVVIHAGTFTKTMFTGLRLAYLVIPERLVDAFAAAFATLGRFAPVLPQLALTEFIAEGDFARHLRRMRVLYAERRSAFLEVMQTELGDELSIVGGSSGFDAVGMFHEPIDEREVCRAALEARLEVRPLSRYAQPLFPKSGLMLGFAAVSAQRTRRAAPVLRRVIAEVRARTRLVRRESRR